MRDINRIDEFLKKLGSIWKQVPDWRFGQLISNIPYDRDPFFLEEDEFIKCAEKLLTRTTVFEE